MDDTTLRGEALRFFDEFVAAFRALSGVEIAHRYLAPYLAWHGTGSMDCLLLHSDIEEYFQSVVDTYHRDGCRSCRYDDLDVTQMGKKCLLATVTWSLLRQDGSVITAWRESYNLARGPSRMQIVASVDHVP